jgi:hypothetical protein
LKGVIKKNDNVLPNWLKVFRDCRSNLDVPAVYGIMRIPN